MNKLTIFLVALLSAGSLVAAGDIGSSGAGLASSLVCLLTGGTGCTMTGQTIYSGVTNDITTGTNEDLTLAPNGSGTTVVRAGTGGYIYLQNSAGVSNGYVKTSTSNTAVFEGNNFAYLSPNANGSATQRVSGLADNDAADHILGAYGGGLTSREMVQTCDCGTTGTPNTVTCDVQSDVVYLTDSDADACTVTIAETSAATINKDLKSVRFIVTSLGGGGNFNVASAAGVVTVVGAAWAGNSVGDNLSLHYLSDSTTDQFFETGRIDNP